MVLMTSIDTAFPSIEGHFACEVYWGDCDPAGIIFYPTYFRWFDAATWALFASVGYTARRMRGEHRALPLVGAECRFLHPAEQADRCEVVSKIQRFGGKSFSVGHDVLRADGKILAQGVETRVWGRHAGGPGTPLKGEAIGDEVKSLFRSE